MTDNTESETDESSDINVSRLREMALRGDQYREIIDFEYYDMEGELYVRPLTDEEFLPIAAFLESRLDIDTEKAQEKLEEAELEDAEGIDTSQFDEEFVEIMQEAAALGIDTSQGIAEGEDDEGVKEIISMLQGGKSLIVAEKVLEISSDAEKAETFRRDGGGE